jgi:hypothetical protein
LTLTRVRFIDVEFEAIPQNKASENLLLGVLKNDGPSVTSKVTPSVGIIFKPGSVLPKAGENNGKARLNQSIFVAAKKK